MQGGGVGLGNVGSDRKNTRDTMGLNSNIPEYLWKTEAGRNRLDVGSKERAGKCMMQILRMDEERWPKICLKEEVRNAVQTTE